MSKKVLNFATFGLLSLIPGKVGKIIRGAGLVAIGIIVPGAQGLIAVGLGMIAGAFAKKPKVSPNAIDRLNASLVPDTPRKIVVGHTAMATDVRYQGFTGTDQEYVHWILCAAAHECQSIDEFWFDTKMAWSASGGVTSDYADYLTVDVRNPGTSVNGIAIDSAWTSTATLTGCAYLHLRFKRTGDGKKAESPFSSSLPTRVTVRGRGALLPDIREVGCDAGDQATWDWFDDDSGRNPALQLLFYLIGWQIGGKLSVGRGMPVDRIDLDSFITAANFCDEPVSLAAGGTEPRYRCDGVFSEGDDPGLVIGNFCGAMNAVMRDTGGKLAVVCLHDTLSTPVAAFDETDILGSEEWAQTPPVDEFYNVVRGRYVDASDAGLYQLVDYPEIEIDSPDGIERSDQFDLAVVQSASQAQRLAKQRLQRNLYRGTYSAKFNERAWQVSLGDIVTLSHIALGWEEKLFRVLGHGISFSGVSSMVLQEENEDIYAWDEEESPPVVAADPVDYDALNSPLVHALSDLADAADAAVDDNILTASEKSQTVIPLVDQLTARYSVLLARGTALSLSTSAMTTAQTNFLTYLNALSPAWNDTTQDTVLATNLVTGDFPAGWTMDSGATSGASGIYTTLTDPGASSSSAYWYMGSVAASVTYSLEIVVKKDAVPNATRRPLLRLATQAGTTKVADIQFDTQTGAVVSTSADVLAAGVYAENDSEWLVWVSCAFGAGNTALIAQIIPASNSSATTGAIDLRDPVVVIGGFDALGRDAFRYRMRAFSQTMDAMAKAISEIDGVTSLQIDGDKTINIAATSAGDASAALPLNRSYVARVGTGSVTAAWSVTVLSGSVTCSIGASDGILEITAIGSVSAKVRIDASYGGASQSYTVQINRVDAAAGGGGGGGATVTEVAVDASVSGTTFTTIGTITQTVASATPALTAPDLEITAVPFGGNGTWNVEFKAVRENGVTDVDIGSVANSNPDPTVSTGPVSDPGYAALSVADSGRSVGVSSTYYLQARLTSGSRSNHITGTFRVMS